MECLNVKVDSKLRDVSCKAIFRINVHRYVLEVCVYFFSFLFFNKIVEERRADEKKFANVS